ncbi:hypothetical protein BDR06DRAFT_760309 [Suillus hirtellus]|nr:hypothetical protein BDR06DRAFT_760309 [Suillus hirtellus]
MYLYDRYACASIRLRCDFHSLPMKLLTRNLYRLLLKSALQNITGIQWPLTEAVQSEIGLACFRLLVSYHESRCIRQCNESPSQTNPSFLPSCKAFRSNCILIPSNFGGASTFTRDSLNQTPDIRPAIMGAGTCNLSVGYAEGPRVSPTIRQKMETMERLGLAIITRVQHTRTRREQR